MRLQMKITSSVISFYRHMLNVSWEHTDFSFNSDGYLVNPSMIIITLDRERQWDKVSETFIFTGKEDT